MSATPASMQSGHAAHMGALFYDGVSTKYTVGDNPNVNAVMNSAPGFTIEMWIKPNSVGLHGGQTRVIATKVDDDPSSQNNGWSIWLEPNGTLVFSVKKDGVVRTTTDTGVITTMQTKWYFVVCSYDTTTNTPNIYVDGVHANESFSSSIPPRFSSSAGGLTLYVGGTNATGNSHFHGGISDFRFWKNKLLTAAEIGFQFSNKYTILNITHVAMAGVSQVGFGEGGGTAPPPPDAFLSSFSPLSFTSDSYTIDRGTVGQGGGYGSSIPAQFYDDFRDAVYSLTTVDQMSPNQKWILATAPDASGYVRTEDYASTGELQNRVLRIRSSTSVWPIVSTNTNTALFNDVYIRATIRTIAQVSTANIFNRAHIMFKRVDSNNFWYLALTSNQAHIVRVTGGTATTVATSPSSTNIFPLGQRRNVEIWVEEGGNRITVSIDGVTDPSSSNYVTTYSGGVPWDSSITADTSVRFRAVASEGTFDNILIRPLFGSGFQENLWNITSGTSPDGKWSVQTAPGTGGVIRTFDFGSTGSAARALNLERGTADPILLSVPAWRNYRVYASCRTISQDVVSTNNRAQLIFKWLNSSNYYYVLVHPSGYTIRRVIEGVDELINSGSTAHADNTYHKIEVRIYNGGREIEVWTAVNLGTLVKRYEEHNNESGQDDNGVLAGSGKIGFRSVQAHSSFDNVSVKPL